MCWVAVAGSLIVATTVDRECDSHGRLGPWMRRPMQKLREAIDLIVVPAIRELENLIDKISEPNCLCRKMNLTRFYSRRLSDKAISFVSLRNDTDGADKSAGRFGL